MFNASRKYNNFIENLRNEGNSELIDTIKAGFQYITESLGTDDANKHPLGQSIPVTGVPANTTNIHPNSDNEYFDKTVSDAVLKIGKHAQAGQRVWEHAKAGKWVVSQDKLKFGTPGNQNTVGGNDDGWAGTSGGYSLGGPTQGSTLS